MPGDTSIDRLLELTKHPPEEEKKERSVSKGPPDIETDLADYDSIQAHLSCIQMNIDTLRKLKATYTKTSDEQKQREILQTYETIMKSTHVAGALIHETLQIIKLENKAYASDQNASPVRLKIKENLFQTTVRSVYQMMSESNKASYAFDVELKHQQKAILRLVDPTMSDEQMETIVTSGKASHHIQEAVIGFHVQNTVNVIDQRYSDIVQVEKQVLEIYELFKMISTLVDLQHESLDVIETHVAQAKTHTEKGEVEIQEANTYQTKARSRTGCMCLVCMCILVGVLVPTLLKTV